MVLRIGFLIALSMVIFGCKKSSINNRSSQSSSFSFLRDSIKLEFGEGCKLPDSLVKNCIFITDFSIRVTSSDSKASKAINDTLDQYLKNTLVSLASFGEDSLNSVFYKLSNNELYKKIQQFHSDQINEIPDFQNVWNVDTYLDTVCVLPKVISFRFTESTFLGGAHPNTFTTLLNFDIKTGKKLEFKHIIKDEKKLLTIAEKAFRNYQELNSSQSLEEAGYFFENGIYSLPLNFSITRDGLEFFYNPYEAAAYAYGPLVFVLPYEQIKDCVHLDLMY